MHSANPQIFVSPLIGGLAINELISGAPKKAPTSGMYNTLVKVYSCLKTGTGNVQNALEVHTHKKDVNNTVYKAYDVKGYMYYCKNVLHGVNMVMSTVHT
jgi:hypothetical protein